MDIKQQFEIELRAETPAGHRFGISAPNVREQALINIIQRLERRVTVLESKQ